MFDNVAKKIWKCAGKSRFKRDLVIANMIIFTGNINWK